MKSVVRNLTPPLLWRVLRYLKQEASPSRAIEWEYMPDGWRDPRRDLHIKGWDVPAVLEATKARMPSFRELIKGTLPLGVSPESPTAVRTNPSFHNTMMIYAYCLTLASRKRDALSMLDWGGGIGQYYWVSQALVPGLQIEYHCKDVPVLAEYGRSILPDLHFHTNDTCLERQYDFVLASGSLHYSEDWRATFRSLAAATSGHLLVTRLPVVRRANSYVAVQRPYRYGYSTEYQGWCLNYEEFTEFAVECGVQLVREFVVDEQPSIRGAPEQCHYWGFLYERSDRAQG